MYRTEGTWCEDEVTFVYGDETKSLRIDHELGGPMGLALVTVELDDGEWKVYYEGERLRVVGKR